MYITNGNNLESVVSQGDNAQIQANMNVVHNILNGSDSLLEKVGEEDLLAA